MRRSSAAALALCVLALASQRSSAQSCSVHTFIGDNPSHGQPGWHDGTQGLTHGPRHWYVTDTRNDKSRSLLWKIPVETNLGADVACGSNGVFCRGLSSLDLDPRYNHYGDPDFYEFNGSGYVLVPLEGDGGVPNGLLIFRADDTLEFLTFTPFPGQGSSPWVAVDPDGILYSSEFNTDGAINRFYLDWHGFQADEHTPPALMRLDQVVLQDETGSPLALPHMQGGEFSDDGRRFYVSNGDGRGDADPAEGIHVFRIAAAGSDQCAPGTILCLVARRLEQSHNSDDPGFSFEFHPGPNLGATGQEPEGLTYWDLDAVGGAPGPPGQRGQLHVVLLDNDFTDAEEVYVKHYSFTDADIEPPVLICPAPAIAECVSPAGVPAGSPQLASFLAGASATDACTAQPLIAHNAPAAFPLGTTPVTFTATDEAGNASSCQAPVTVVDTTAPTISVGLSRDILWPPNHKLVPITAHVTVGDTCGSPAFELVAITSSDPDDGTGDGTTLDDIQGAAFGTPDTSFLLRAERSGSTPGGRVYTIVYRVIDGSGNASTATAFVRVPHSK
jgi:hypothetical protein